MGLRQKATEDLKQAHLELNQMFNAAVPLAVIKLDKTILRVNDTFCSLFEGKEEEAIGQSCQAFWQQPFCNSPECPMQKILNGLKHYEYEIEKNLNHGRRLFLLVTAIPYKNAKGKIIGLVKNFTDITKQKHIEKALLESEEKFRKYFELGLIGVAIISSEKRFLEVNDRLSEIFGYSAKELKNITWADLIPAEDLIAEEGKYDLFLDGNGPEIPFERRYLRGKDGRIIYVNVSAKCVRRSDRSVAYYVSIIEDITERKLAEERLQKAEKEKSIILNSLSELVIYQDTQMRLLWVNQAAAQYANQKSEEMIGRTCHEIWHNSSQLCLDCPAVKAGITREPLGREITTSDGNIWFVLANPVKDFNGQVIGFVEIATDM